MVLRAHSLSYDSRAVCVIVFALFRGDDDDGCWLIVSVKIWIISVYTFT